MAFTTPPTKILIFVLGPPGAGKTTLCTLLEQTYNFTHVAVGNELRSLVKNPPASSPNLTEAEVLTIKQHLGKSELVPENIMNKYLGSRVFGDGKREGNMRVLVDGFPRSAAQFERFVEAMKGHWNPRSESEDPDTHNSIKALLLVINCNPMIAQQRVLGRGRDVMDSEEVFQKRVKEYEEQKEEIVMAFREVGVALFEIEGDENEGSRTEDVKGMAGRAVVKLGKILGLGASLE